MDNGEYTHSNGDNVSASRPSILGIGTANPPHIVKQDAYINFVMNSLGVPPESDIGSNLKKLGVRTEINQRYFVSDDANKPREEWKDLPKDFPQTSPGMTLRNEIYWKHAPTVALTAAKQAISNWGGDVNDLTHVISVSCTGVMAPGIELHLLKELGLKSNIQRLGINMMGCFGAFRGIAAAKALAKENPKNRILLVCVEICSIHFQTEMAIETFIANALFADGAGSVIVGQSPKPTEHAIWEIEDVASSIIENTPNDMTWRASDKGFVMTLSHKIPNTIKSSVVDFANNLIDGRADKKECGWAIHPGGSAIVKGIEETLGLDKWQTQCSWDVLRDYGNMSSATFLFILENLKKNNKPQQQTDCPWTVGLGFGPGLALEGVLLKWV